MKCFAILLQTEFHVGGKKLFDLGKATEECNEKRIKKSTRSSTEIAREIPDEKSRGKEKDGKSWDARGSAHVTNVKRRVKESEKVERPFYSRDRRR